MKYEPQTLKRWTQPDSYCGAEWPEYYVFLGRHRDSDALERANFDAGKAALDKLPEFEGESLSRSAVRESHWAVGWVEWLAIHEDDSEALKVADEIAIGLESYPVVKEELFSRYEEDEAQEVWQNCYDWKERAAYVRKFRSQFDFRDLADMLGSIRGKWFGGYASELLA